MRKTRHYGYYLFLGLGDFEQSPARVDDMSAPVVLSGDWTRTWDLLEWERRIDQLARLGANTLFFLLTGHKLPYKSQCFPECVDMDHPNVHNDFLQKVLEHALERDIRLVAVFSTTGHAKSFVSSHPHLAIQDRTGTFRVNEGIMCHHHEEARQYPLMVIRECLTKYHGFVGAMLHPPEFLKPCFCSTCQEIYGNHTSYRESHVSDLLSAPDEEAQRFFMETNLSFHKTVLESEVKRHLPEAQLFICTIPWAFEPHFEKIATHIDKSTNIIEWDYNMSEGRISLLYGRLKRYRQFGHEVWFMPTSGFAFSKTRSQTEQARVVLSQIRMCLESDVKDIIYFMGPTWWPTVEETSWYLHGYTSN